MSTDHLAPSAISAAASRDSSTDNRLEPAPSPPRYVGLPRLGSYAEYPGMIRRIILCGSAPRGGEGLVFDDLSVDELNDPAALVMKAFFTQSEASQASGRAYLERLKSRVDDRDTSVSKPSALAELAALREWGVIPPSDRFAMLGKIRHPALVVQGNKDVVVLPINAFLLAEHLPNAQLIMYPDASHGVQSQHADVFLEHAKLFLR